ncbi:MAG: hypothetical protein H8D75_00015 [Rhodospirillaceae bacterium]|nr:hypothetical protein [Rhodospirillaceae bacterium]
MIDRASTQLAKAKGEFGSGISKKISHSRHSKLTDLMVNVRGMISSVENLSSEAGSVSEVMSQAGSIATNIAIEASTAGAYEAEFNQVANTMREFASELRAMCDSAGGAIRDAGSVGKVLQHKAQESLN